MSDTTAHINAKGCDGTGLTENLAAELYHRVGHSFMAIVEIQVVDKSGPNLKDKRKVHLGLTQVWPAEDDNLDNHLRELTRVLHQNNAVTGADGSRQQILTEERDGIEPTVEGVIAANPGLKPHPYVSSQLAIDDTDAGPVCDVCGKVEAETIHHMPTSDPFVTAIEAAAGDPDEEEPEPDSDDEEPVLRDTPDDMPPYDDGSGWEPVDVVVDA